MENRLAIVIVVDGLRASALGTYGNTTYPTPHLDQFASQSLVVEWLLAESPTLDGFYKCAWGPSAGSQNSLPRTMQQAGVRHWLLTDDPTISQLPETSDFDEVVCVDQGQEISAETMEETHSARFLIQAIEQLALWQKQATQDQVPAMLWIHFSGYSGPWDAPLNLRAEHLDEEDPLPPGFVAPPSALTTEDIDELLGFRVAYAAQTAVLESCLAGFLEAVDALSLNSPLLTMLMSSRGYSLGEHGCVGVSCDTLYTEQVHLPLLIKRGETPSPLPRVTGFAQLADMRATLVQWLMNNSSEDISQGISLVPFLNGDIGQLRQLAIASGPNENHMIRTPAWQLHVSETPELYAKPDDHWEANDIASRCPEIVHEMTEVLTQCLQGGPADAIATQLSLPEGLVSLWR